MKTQKYISLFFYLFFITSTISWAQEIQLPELAKEIRQMRDTDQKLRIKWAKMAKKGDRESKKFIKLTDQTIKTDSLNIIRMKEIVDKHGWPTYTLVGRGASASAWLLVQHADRDPLFQIKCLSLLKQAVDDSLAAPINYAYLYDRVQVALGKKQLYATQSSTNNGIKKGAYYPIENEALVQKRREEMGFDISVTNNAKRYGFEYVVPSKEQAEQKALAYSESYVQNINAAKQAMEQKDFTLASNHYIQAMENYGSLKNEDLVSAAKAMSLAKHKDSYTAISYLHKAALNGWEGSSDFDTDPDLEHLKSQSPRNWEILMRTVGWLTN